MLIGAHPDDCELNAGGTAVKWGRAGFRVLLVSMTNGDIGHHEMAGGPLARRRAEEAREAAERGGVEHWIFDNHDGELQPTLAVRKEVVKLIRSFKADAVITHRPNDYHPDHRYTAQIVQDSAYMVTVPFFAPDVPALRKNPVFMYFMDNFQKPLPFHADIAVAVDDVMETKWRMLDAIESQVYEWLPWHAGVLDQVPSNPGERISWLKNFWTPIFARGREASRAALANIYGEKTATETQFAELFELSEYGARPSESELRDIFPFLPGL